MALRLPDCPFLGQGQQYESSHQYLRCGTCWLDKVDPGKIFSPKGSWDNAFLAVRSGDKPEEELLGIGCEVGGTETP
jgi:hypothetical protein